MSIYDGDGYMQNKTVKVLVYEDMGHLMYDFRIDLPSDVWSEICKFVKTESKLKKCGNNTYGIQSHYKMPGAPTSIQRNNTIYAIEYSLLDAKLVTASMPSFSLLANLFE